MKNIIKIFDQLEILNASRPNCHLKVILEIIDLSKILEHLQSSFYYSHLSSGEIRTPDFGLRGMDVNQHARVTPTSPKFFKILLNFLKCNEVSCTSTKFYFKLMMNSNRAPWTSVQPIELMQPLYSSEYLLNSFDFSVAIIWITTKFDEYIRISYNLYNVDWTT